MTIEADAERVRTHGARPRPLPVAFYNRDTAIVARDLLGKLLVVRAGGVRRVGRIVETEAYLGEQDKASHSSRGMTERNRVMFGPPARAYVYRIYGMHDCLNVVTGPEGHGSAVLLRALEPVENVTERTRGPGLLCRAMGVDRSFNGRDLRHRDFCIAQVRSPPPAVVCRPRIGVDYAGPRWAGRLLRFCIRGHPSVSRP